MNDNTTIKQWTIAFWIKENSIKYNDNKDTLIFTINPEWWSILMNKDENNNLHVAFVAIWKWRIDLHYNVSDLKSKIAHMIAFTRNINTKISLYIDGQLVVENNVKFKDIE